MRIRDLTAAEFETFLDVEVPPRVMLEDGDLVVGMDGDFNVVRWNRGAAALNQRLCRLRPTEAADLRFVQYALPAQLQWINETQYATTVKHLSSGEILGCRIPCPPQDVQRRIADFLDDETTRIDNVISARRTQLDLLKESIRAVAWEQVSGQTVSGPRTPTRVPWVDDLPRGWGSPRVCQVARIGTGHTPSRSEPDYWVDCDIPWLTTADVHGFRFDEVDEIDKTEMMISDLGIANSAAVLHPAGTVALSRTASAGFSIIMGRDMATSQDYATWTCGPLLDNRFLLWCLRAMRRDLLGRLAMGSTHKTIYFPDLMSIRVPLPPKRDQLAAVREIGLAVDSVRRAMSDVERSVALLNEFKRSLISAAVSGEFDVTASSGGGLPT